MKGILEAFRNSSQGHHWKIQSAIEAIDELVEVLLENAALRENLEAVERTRADAVANAAQWATESEGLAAENGVLKKRVEELEGYVSDCNNRAVQLVAERDNWKRIALDAGELEDRATAERDKAVIENEALEKRVEELKALLASKADAGRDAAILSGEVLRLAGEVGELKERLSLAMGRGCGLANVLLLASQRWSFGLSGATQKQVDFFLKQLGGEMETVMCFYRAASPHEDRWIPARFLAWSTVSRFEFGPTQVYPVAIVEKEFTGEIKLIQAEDLRFRFVTPASVTVEKEA